MTKKAITLKDENGNLIYPCPYYPVGAIYMSVNNHNPANIFGGKWEQIKDVSDKELLAMAMAIRGLYDENIVEAASMELYQRDSQLLREQFMLMMPDDVSSIASGTAPAPEGIRLAAQKYLSQK